MELILVYNGKCRTGAYEISMLGRTKRILLRTWNLAAHGAYIPTEYFVFEDRELIYISVPKVACTSIKIALMKNDVKALAADAQYMDVHEMSAKYRQFSISSRQRRFFKFAFVRDPFDRLVSCYKDKVQREVQHTGRYYFATTYNELFLRKVFGDKFRSNMSFEEFVRLVCRIPDFLADGHFRSQYSILYRNGRLIPDFIGKSEAILEDWQPIADRFRLEALGTRNRTQSEDRRKYYCDEEIVKSVAQRYKRDIESFNYSAAYQRLLSQVRGTTG